MKTTYDRIRFLCEIDDIVIYVDGHPATARVSDASIEFHSIKGSRPNDDMTDRGPFMVVKEATFNAGDIDGNEWIDANEGYSITFHALSPVDI